MERAGFSVRDIHGDLDQAQRTATLEAFKRGEIAFLVATDVAARGLDIVMLPCVINYDVPTHAEDYVHRLGRTGRAGQAGRAFTLVLPDEGRYVDAITRLTGKPIPRLEIGGLDGAELAPTTRARARRGRAAAAPTAARPAAEAEISAPARPEAKLQPEPMPHPEPEPRAETSDRPQARSRPEARPPEPGRRGPASTRGPSRGQAGGGRRATDRCRRGPAGARARQAGTEVATEPAPGPRRSRARRPADRRHG